MEPPLLSGSPSAAVRRQRLCRRREAWGMLCNQNSHSSRRVTQSRRGGNKKLHNVLVLPLSLSGIAASLWSVSYGCEHYFRKRRARTNWPLLVNLPSRRVVQLMLGDNCLQRAILLRTFYTLIFFGYIRLNCILIFEIFVAGGFFVMEDFLRLYSLQRLQKTGYFCS